MKYVLIGSGATCSLAPPGGRCLFRLHYLALWLPEPSRTTMGITWFDVWKDWAKEQNADWGTPSLSPCFLKQSLCLHHTPYSTHKVRTLTQHTGNLWSPLLFGRPTSGNQFSPLTSSKPRWQGGAGCGTSYRRFGVWLEKSENYSTG